MLLNIIFILILATASININIIFILILATASINASETNETALEKMNEMTKAAEVKWKYNPLRSTHLERLMVGWQDPYANITRFWIGANLNAHGVFPNPNFHIDDIMAFFTPTIATELSAIAFDADRLKFRMGIGVLIDLNMGVYKEHIPLYGQNFVFSDNVQVEVFVDFYIDEVWKVRWLPLIHRCNHNSGDWYGDPALYDPESTPYGDTGNEAMGFQLFYNYGWLTFYGGFDFNINYGFAPTFVTLFAAHYGTDLRVPVWGQINFITGFYLAGEYTEYNDKTRTTVDGVTETTVTDTYKQWNYIASVGIGFEIYNYTIGAKYIKRPSTQIHSHTAYDEKVGLEITILY